SNVHRMLAGMKRRGPQVRKFESHGNHVTQTRYKKDGAQVQDTVRTRKGYRQEITTVTRDGHTERTVSTTRLDNRPIDKLVPHIPQPRLGGPSGPDAARPGKSGPTAVTSVTRTEQDPGQDPVTLDKFKT